MVESWAGVSRTRSRRTGVGVTMGWRSVGGRTWWKSKVSMVGAVDIE